MKRGDRETTETEEKVETQGRKNGGEKMESFGE